MSVYANKSKYKKIALMTVDIAEKLGFPIYKYWTEKGNYFGQKYVFKDLDITYFKEHPNNAIYIYLSNDKVFCYDFTNDDVEYTKGDWENLIKIIYNQIPSLTNIENENNKEFEDKMIMLKSLESYFESCVYLNQNEDALKVFNNIIFEYGLYLEKKK